MVYCLLDDLQQPQTRDLIPNAERLTEPFLGARQQLDGNRLRMARTIETQVRQLERAGEALSERVRERTADLETGP